MRALIVATLLAGGVPAAQAYAQTAPAAQTDPEPIAGRIFESLTRGEIPGAIKAISDASPTGDAELKGRLDGIRGQIQALIASSGPVLRWERVKTESLGTMVRRDTYIVQHRDSAYRWRFIYVKIGRGWIIGMLAFEDEATTWFD